MIWQGSPCRKAERMMGQLDEKTIFSLDPSIPLKSQKWPLTPYPLSKLNYGGPTVFEEVMTFQDV